MTHQTALDRPAALALCRLPASVPDGPLSDLAAELTGADAATLRRGWALERARGLLAELAAHDGNERCAECGAVMTASEPRRCSDADCNCVRPAPMPAELTALLADALTDAGDPRAKWRDPVNAVAWMTRPACPKCGGDYYYHDGGRLAYHRACGWSGHAAALLPPLLSRAELDRRVEALRKGR